MTAGVASFYPRQVETWSASDCCRDLDVTTVIVNRFARVKSRPALNALQKLGMQRAVTHATCHPGVAVFIVLVTIVTGYQSEKDVRMYIGDRTRWGHFRFKALQGHGTHTSRTSEIEVSKNGIPTPCIEKRAYRAPEIDDEPH